MTVANSNLQTVADQDGAVILDIERGLITTLNATGYTIISSTSSTCWGDTEGYANTFVSTITWSDPSGTSHTFDATITEVDTNCPDGNDTSSQSISGGYAVDGSGYSVQDDGTGQPLVIDSNGSQVYPQVIDRFGNYWSSDSNGDLVDDVGRTPVIVTSSGNTTYYDVLAPNGTINNNGTRVRYTVTTAPVSVSTTFSPTNVANWSGTLYPVHSIQLPDTTSYTFYYDNFGELTSVVLPTGGTVYYGWSNYVDSGAYMNRWVASRQLGSATATTFTPQVLSYCPGFNNTNCQEQVTVHEPSGDEKLYQFILNNGAWNTDTTVYTGSVGSGQALIETTNAYDFSHACPTSICNGSQYIKVSTETTSLSGASLKSQNQYVYGNPAFGKPTAVKEWDYYSTAGLSGPPSTTPTREIDYAYTGFDLQQVTVFSNGIQAGQTTYGYTSTATPTTGITQHGTQNAGGPYLQTVTHWLNTSPTQSPVTTYTMDDTGMMVRMVDPKQNPATTFTYQCANTLPYQVSTPLGQTTTYGYDCNSGAITSVQDPNDLAANRPGTQYTYESLAGRPQHVTYPDGGQTSYSYPSSTEVDTSILATPDPTISSQDIVDSFGRPYQHLQAGISSETNYDTNGRINCVTNPHFASTGSTTDGSTCITSYDGLGRPLVQAQPDGTSQLNWSYSGNVTTSYDETGKGWKRTTDAFGHLTQVLEPGPSDGTGTICGPQGCRSIPALTYETDYVYDGLGNLKTISQLGGSGDTARQRTFTYDSLARLVQTSSPEAGSTCYGTTPGNAPASSTNCTSGYDLNGNLQSKTDSRGQRLNYAYDPLNRMTSKTSVDGTTYNFYSYDNPASLYGGTSYPCSNGIGRVCLAEHTGNTGTAFNYDLAGRTASTITSTWTSNSGIYTPMMAVTYNAAGNPHVITYPDGRQIAQSYDSSGRLQSVASSAGTTTYYTANSFAPTGQAVDISLGNNFHQNFTFNNRMQMCTETATMGWGTPSAQQLFSKQFFFATSATSPCTNAANNNGNISSIVDYYYGGTTPHTQTMQYDSLNRLTSAVHQDGIYNRSYTPDAFGNMLPVNNGTGTHPSLSITAANQLQLSVSQYSYDADGTLLSTGSPSSNSGHSFSYNSEDLMMSVDGGATATYGYNALGERVYKLATTGTTLEYAYLDGQPMAEESPNGTWTDYIYAGAGMVAKADSADTRFHLTGINGATTDTGRWTVGVLPIPSGITFQTGDVLNYRIYQHNAVAGISMGFSDGSNSDWYNNGWKWGSIQPDTWVNLSFSLDGPMVNPNKVLNQFQVGNYQGGPDGPFDVMIADLAITHADGSVTPIPIPLGSYSWGGDTTAVTGGSFVGEQVGTISGQPGAVALTRYFLGDHLGTIQYELASGGWPMSQAIYTPFGEEITPQTTMNHYKFASLERDAESSDASGNGLDHAQFRQYSSPLGRWMSPDPYNGSMNLSNPQSLNRYAYVNNGPLNFIDPSGLDGGALATGGCYAAVVQGGLDVPADVACGIFLAIDGLILHDLLGHHHALSIPKQRPNAQIWDEYHIHYGPNIAGALGLPSGGCEFGACGAGGSFVQGQDPKNPSKLIEFGPGSFICGDFVCGPNGRLGVAPCGGCIQDSSGLIFMGAGVARDAAGVGIEAAGEGASSGLQYLFRPGSWVNQGQYWRIGFGRKGGVQVFRSVIFGWKKDWWTGGPL